MKVLLLTFCYCSAWLLLCTEQRLRQYGLLFIHSLFFKYSAPLKCRKVFRGAVLLEANFGPVISNLITKKASPTLLTKV